MASYTPHTPDESLLEAFKYINQVMTLSQSSSAPEVYPSFRSIRFGRLLDPWQGHPWEAYGLLQQMAESAA